VRLIACVDDRDGMAFHQRRQSRDRVVRQHILADAAGARLWMNARSARQFAQSEQGLLLVAEDYLDRAQAGDFCFVEDRSPAPWLDRLEEVRLYRWGRVYPADVWLGLDLADGWALVSQEQFPGWSHDTITKEVYRR